MTDQKRTERTAPKLYIDEHGYTPDPWLQRPPSDLPITADGGKSLGDIVSTPADLNASAGGAHVRSLEYIQAKYGRPPDEAIKQMIASGRITIPAQRPAEPEPSHREDAMRYMMAGVDWGHSQIHNEDPYANVSDEDMQTSSDGFNALKARYEERQRLRDAVVEASLSMYTSYSTSASQDHAEAVKALLAFESAQEAKAE